MDDGHGEYGLEGHELGDGSVGHTAQLLVGHECCNLKIFKDYAVQQ